MEIPAGLPNEIRIVVEQLEQQLRAFTQSNINMDGRKIINLGKGISPREAVTVSQLKDAIDALRDDIQTRINAIRKGI